MVILFKPEHVQPIKFHQKVETRRVWKNQRVKEGKVYQARTKLFGTAFTYLRILAVRKERLAEIDAIGAIAEGYRSVEEFQQAWIRINGEWDPDIEVYVVRFKVETWEDQYPLGCEVIVTKDDGTEVRTRTRSTPFVLGGVPVVSLEDVSGPYALERVRRP